MPQMVVPKSSSDQSVRFGDLGQGTPALEAQEPGQGGFLGEPGPGNDQDNSRIALEYSKNPSWQNLIG